MAEWKETKTGTSVIVHDTVKTAYQVILLLERERVPRVCVDDVLKAVKDILNFQEVVHTAQDERNPSFPK